MWCDVCEVCGMMCVEWVGLMVHYSVEKDSWVSTVGGGWAYRNGEVCGLGAEAKVEDDAPMEAH